MNETFHYRRPAHLPQIVEEDRHWLQPRAISRAAERPAPAPWGKTSTRAPPPCTAPRATVRVARGTCVRPCGLGAPHRGSAAAASAVHRRPATLAPGVVAQAGPVAAACP